MALVKLKQKVTVRNEMLFRVCVHYFVIYTYILNKFEFELEFTKTCVVVHIQLL